MPAACLSVLGQLSDWPEALRNAIGLISGSGFPMFLVWGPRRILLYNDAYIPILGSLHPGAIGQPFWGVWPEVRPQIEPIIEAAFAGESSSFQDYSVTLLRDGRPEKAWFTFSYSPILGASGEVLGALCVCVETTHETHNASKLAFFDRLSVAAGALADADDIMRVTTRLVGEQMGVSVCAFADMDSDEDGFTIRGDWAAEGSSSIVGRYRLADFGALAVTELSAGRALVISNNLEELPAQEAAAFQAIGISATICMPLVRAGKLRALMAVHHKAPHLWTRSELDFIREVTDRSWAYIERLAAEAQLQASEEQLRLAIEAAEVGLWDVDPIRDDLYWPARVKAMFGISADAPVSMSADFFPCLHPEDRHNVIAAYGAAVDPDLRALYDVEYRTIGKEDGVIRWVAAKGRGLFNDKGECYRVIGTAVDITARKRAEEKALEQSQSLAILNTTGSALAAGLDLENIVQLVTDAGVRITGAEFGAFFYNAIDEAGERYTLYALSGVERSRFDAFPMPRNTAVFAPTFHGEGVVRSGDITLDPRYGKNAPHHGMPEGHLPVRSYLAVPVCSRSGEVLGGLFFGHSRPNVFTAESEELINGIAGHASVAIDNVRLYQATQTEVRQRRKAEEQQLLLINELNHRVKNSLSTVQSIVSQTSRNGRSAEEVRSVIEGRILALSAAHDLLTQHKWEGAGALDVIERAVAAFNPSNDQRVAAAGPSIPLTPAQALSLSMALHELGTNAIKYGALSVPEGEVSIVWFEQDDQMVLDWREVGGPKVSPPKTRGFGSRLLQRALSGDLKGSVDLEFLTDGVRCRIVTPIEAAGLD